MLLTPSCTSWMRQAGRVELVHSSAGPTCQTRPPNTMGHPWQCLGCSAAVWQRPVATANARPAPHL
eukprot:8263689-Lingulodinium_polyedra.AAC.1